MRYLWKDLFAMTQTPLGRLQLKEGLYQTAWPLMRFVATLYRSLVIPNTKMIAVVGSLGKTTTMRAICYALGVPIHATSSRNSKSFVAGKILKTRPRTAYSVLEVGIDRPGQMAGYARLIRPDVAVVTTVASEHHRSLGSLENTAAEKSQMVKMLPSNGMAVLNGDDPLVRAMGLMNQMDAISYGLDGTCDVNATSFQLHWPHGMQMQIQIQDWRGQLQTRIMGRHMVYPILAALAVCKTVGMDLNTAAARLETLPPTPGRMQLIPLKSGAYILRDDYKSTLETIHAAIDVLAEIRATRKTVVLGEVSEPPGSQGPIYRAIGERLGKTVDRLVVLAGKNIQRYTTGAVSAGMPKSAIFDAGRNILNAIEFLNDSEIDEVILIKGRDNQRFDRVALGLMGREVRCVIKHCDARSVRCEECPMLERGWGKKPITI